MILKKLCIVAAVMISYHGQAQDFDWVRSFGSTGYNQGQSVAVDAGGNVYATGSFSGTADFDPGVGVNNLNSVGDVDVFISKLDASGNLIWAKSCGGLSNDYGQCIKVDLQGNVYVTGWFHGTVDFDPGPGTFTLSSNANYDAFILKLNPAGDFVWAGGFGGGTSSNSGQSLVLDQAGNVYVTGYFLGTADFDPGAGTFNLVSAGSNDAFISKFDVSGNLVWAKSIGGTGSDRGLAIALDAVGNVYTAGHFESTVDFDPGPATYTLITASLTDVFISKLDASGNFVWAKSMGGVDYDTAESMAVDASGNVYTTGRFGFMGNAPDFDPGPGTYTLAPAGGYDIFVFKLNAFGNFVWAQKIGSAGDDYGNSIVLDPQGNPYVTGRFSGTVDFDGGPATYTMASVGGSDVFVIRLDAAGNLVWSRSVGGMADDVAYSIGFNAGSVYLTGSFMGTVDFDPAPGSFNLSAVSTGSDIFILKLKPRETGLQDDPENTTAGLRCYPNPGNGSLSILFSADAHLQMLNSLGQVVKTIGLNAGNGYQADIQGLASGMYYLTGQTSRGIINQKIVVAN